MTSKEYEDLFWRILYYIWDQKGKNPSVFAEPLYNVLEDAYKTFPKLKNGIEQLTQPNSPYAGIIKDGGALQDYFSLNLINNRLAAEAANQYVNERLIKSSTRIEMGLEQDPNDAKSEIKQETLRYEMQKQGIIDLRIKTREKESYAFDDTEVDLRRDGVFDALACYVDTGNKYSLGNCAEHAYFSLSHVLHEYPDIKAEVFDCEGFDHGFTVIGRAKGSSPANPNTWGPDAYICDSWIRGVFTPAEFMEKMKSLGFDENKHSFSVKCKRDTPIELNTDTFRKRNTIKGLEPIFKQFEFKLSLIASALNNLKTGYQSVLSQPLSAQMKLHITKKLQEINTVLQKIKILNCLRNSLPQEYANNYWKIREVLKNHLHTLIRDSNIAATPRIPIQRKSDNLVKNVIENYKKKMKLLHFNPVPYNNISKMLSEYFPPQKNTLRKKQHAFLSEVFNKVQKDKTITPQQANTILVGALLFIKKMIRSESFFYHGSKLLAQIEKILKEQNIKLSSSSEKEAIMAMQKYIRPTSSQSNSESIHLEFKIDTSIKLSPRR